MESDFETYVQLQAKAAEFTRNLVHQVKQDQIRIADLEEEVSAWRLAYREASSAKEVALNQVKLLNEGDPIVLCLLDGDGYIFDRSMLVKGRDGGREAALALSKSISAFSDKKLGGVKCQVICTVFLNKAGMSKVLADLGIVSQEIFSNFVLGFNAAHPLFQFADVGSQKEAADAKIRAQLRLYATLPSTKLIFAGLAHDGGYVSPLQTLETEGLMEKIYLLKGYDEVAFELKRLNLKTISFENIFEPKKLSFANNNNNSNFNFNNHNFNNNNNNNNNNYNSSPIFSITPKKSFVNVSGYVSSGGIKSSGGAGGGGEKPCAANGFLASHGKPQDSYNNNNSKKSNLSNTTPKANNGYVSSSGKGGGGGGGGGETGYKSSKENREKNNSSSSTSTKTPGVINYSSSYPGTSNMIIPSSVKMSSKKKSSSSIKFAKTDEESAEDSSTFTPIKKVIGAIKLKLMDPTKSLSKQIPPPCNNQYLTKKGCNRDDCKYGHHYILTKKHIEMLKEDAKKSPCAEALKGKKCASECFAGHECPWGTSCRYAEECRFSGNGMHRFKQTANAEGGGGGRGKIGGRGSDDDSLSSSEESDESDDY